MKKFNSLLVILLSTLFLLRGCTTDVSEQSITTQEPTQVESLQTTQEPEEQIEKKQESEIQTEETQKPVTTEKPIQATAPTFDLSSIPNYSESPYVAVNGNVPYLHKQIIQLSRLKYFHRLIRLVDAEYALMCIATMCNRE